MARRSDKATKVGEAVLKKSINGSDTDETVRSGNKNPIVAIDDIVRYSFAAEDSAPRTATTNGSTARQERAPMVT